MPDPTVLLALSGTELVGFKIGYAMTATLYYSWLGGVLPDYRRQGVATELMRRQHAWAAARYPAIETRTSRTNVAMAQLNLKHGFVMCGFRVYPDATQVLFEKPFRQAGTSRSRGIQADPRPAIDI